MIDKGQGFYHIGAYIYRIGPDGDMVRATSARPVLHGGSLMICATFGDETYHFPSAPFRVLDVVENQAVIDADFRRENGRDRAPDVAPPEPTDTVSVADATNFASTVVSASASPAAQMDPPPTDSHVSAPMNPESSTSVSLNSS